MDDEEREGSMSAVVGDGSVVVWDSAAVPVGCPESAEREKNLLYL